MSAPNSFIEDTRSDIRELEKLIRNCQHGGPKEAEQAEPWFRECAQQLHYTPIETIVPPKGEIYRGSDDDISRALIETIHFITSNFQLSMRNVGSRKFFAAMAVDAWFYEDYLYVRKFLIKSLTLCRLQTIGASNVIEEIKNNGLLIQQVKGVLRSEQQGLQSYLEHCNNGACRCIQFAQCINDERETIFGNNPNRDDIESRRIQREDERLPPILRTSSKYWTIKTKAAAFLKRKQPEKAKELYVKARALLESKRIMHGKIPMHEKEWQIKIGREIAKIASNLSMLYLASGEKDEALKFATDATKMSPEWHKAYCRRALALVALGQYNEAHVAVFNAIKKCSVEIDGGVELVMNRKELKEYKKIKADIQTKMGCANEHDSIFEGNPLHQPLNCKLSSDDKDAGTIFSIVATLDIMDLVYNLLTPMDVANLECTCKRLAVNPERGRRISIASRCYWRFIDSEVLTVSDEMTVEVALQKYACSVNQSPIEALREFILEVRDIIDKDVWKECIKMIIMDPMSRKTILDNTFPIDASTVFDIIDTESDSCFDTSFDFIKANAIMKNCTKDSCGLFVVHLMTNLYGSGRDEFGKPNAFVKKFITHSTDLEVMRLLVSFEGDDYNDDSYDRDTMRRNALALLFNIMFSVGSDLKRGLNQEDPLTQTILEFHSLYVEHVPDEWPCSGAIVDSFAIAGKESIKQYWLDYPEMWGMWRLAILNLLKWVHKVEIEGYNFEYLLCSKHILSEIVDTHTVSNFSFGPFLVMKAVEYGGAVSLSVKLRTQDDFTTFFSDYYDFLHVISEGFRAIVRFNEEVIALQSI